MRIVTVYKNGKKIGEQIDYNWTDNLEEPTKEDYEQAVKVGRVEPLNIEEREVEND